RRRDRSPAHGAPRPPAAHPRRRELPAGRHRGARSHPPRVRRRRTRRPPPVRGWLTDRFEPLFHPFPRSGLPAESESVKHDTLAVLAICPFSSRPRRNISTEDIDPGVGRLPSRRSHEQSRAPLSGVTQTSLWVKYFGKETE